MMNQGARLRNLAYGHFPQTMVHCNTSNRQVERNAQPRHCTIEQNEKLLAAWMFRQLVYSLTLWELFIFAISAYTTSLFQ